MRTRALLVLASLLVPSMIPAQQPLLPLQAGRWVYNGRVDQGVSAHNEADRVITVSETTHEGAPAWRVALLIEVGGGSIVDTLLMRKDNLAPIHRRSVSDTIFEIVYRTQDSLVTGFTKTPGRNGPISARLIPNTFYNYHAFRFFFRGLPLAPGYSATAALVLPRGDSGQVVPVTVTVAGEERIHTPAGPCDCYVIIARGQGVGEIYWVDKTTRYVVRTREPFGGQGAVLQLDLASFTPR